MVDFWIIFSSSNKLVIFSFQNSKICMVFVGHCVEFNVRGGVIQDQITAPCNKTFPMCSSIYSSSDAYKCKVSEVFNIMLPFEEFISWIIIYLINLNLKFLYIICLVLIFADQENMVRKFRLQWMQMHMNAYEPRPRYLIVKKIFTESV